MVNIYRNSSALKILGKDIENRKKAFSPQKPTEYWADSMARLILQPYNGPCSHIIIFLERCHTSHLFKKIYFQLNVTISLTCIKQGLSRKQKHIQLAQDLRQFNQESLNGAGRLLGQQKWEPWHAKNQGWQREGRTSQQRPTSGGISQRTPGSCRRELGGNPPTLSLTLQFSEENGSEGSSTT